MSKYLDKKIVEMITTDNETRYGMSRDGYTLRSGAPTSKKIRLDGEKIWRRLMVWQFSNAGTCFVKIKGECYIVPEHTLPVEK